MSGARQAPASVLLVEDDPRIRRLVQRMLTRAGWEVCEANSAAQAIARLRDRRFPVALVDISMPEMSGLELCHAIRAHPEWSGMRLVAATAHAFSQDREKFLAAGFDDVLTKPFLMEDLYRVVAPGPARATG
jgi:CheY-like chemotaxis protein